MPLIAYRKHRFNAKGLETVARVNQIVEEYNAQGFVLTLRQIFYQFVSRDWIPNSQKSYKALGDVINKARLSGRIDWNAVIDRTRELTAPSCWDSPTDIVRACANQFRLDRWAPQPNYMEVWIEKDALEGVIERICKDNSVPFFSCRGYTGQSAMWQAGRRLMEIRDSRGTPDKLGCVKPKVIHIIHFGDHDPSGCDMSRDVEERLEEFSEGPINFHRAALNMDQIKKYRPPPNPAKLTDSRSNAYIRQHGKKSWELDALEPKVINGLILQWINKLRDQKLWDQTMEEEQKHKDDLGVVASYWGAAVKGASAASKKKGQ